MANLDNSDVQSLVMKGVPQDEAIEVVAALDALELQVGRLAFNVRRVESLVAAAVESTATSPPLGEDILRSAVVLLHATLEDYLRTLAGAYLKFAPREALDGIPLAGQRRERAEKFLLGALGDFRDRSVLDLIALSISEHLERRTFNNIEDIVALVQHLGCEIDELKPFFSNIGAMMARRHVIVHRADLAMDQHPRKTAALGTIEPTDVSRWAEAVQAFALLTTNRVTAARLEALRSRTFFGTPRKPKAPPATEDDD